MPLNMTSGRIDLTGIAKVTPAKAVEMSKHITQARDVLLSRRGDIGRYCLVDSANAGVLCGTGSLRVSIQGSSLMPEYLCFYLETPRGLHQLQSRAVGSTMPNINAEIVRSLEIPVPPLPVQCKIVTILSAYDRLIENNNRRIKLLEEVAQRIYREWFVDFRYPGYEEMSLVESELGNVPQGWKVGVFTDLAEILSGGTPRTTEPENWDGDIPFFTPRDAPDALVVLGTEKHITQAGLDRCNSRLYPPGTIFITARGTVGKVVMAGVPMAMNQSCYAVVGREGVSQEFILFALLNKVAYLRTNTGGATFDTIVVDTFRRMRTLTPPMELISAFAGEVASAVQLMAVLQKQAKVLNKTRDLLLPRLISGELDISDLDITVPELTA